MIESDVLRLNDMSVGELKEMWRQYFDSEPIWKTKRFYIPRLAYRMQELAYGGVPAHVKDLLLGKTVLKRSETDDTGFLPPVGTRLVKTYMRILHTCLVLSTLLRKLTERNVGASKIQKMLCFRL